MLHFSKLISILSFITIIYSIYAMRLEQAEAVFYIGTLIMSITIFILSIGILSMSIINKKIFKKRNLTDVTS